MKETLLNLLRDDEALAALLGKTDDRANVDWVTRPDGGNYPALT